MREEQKKIDYQIATNFRIVLHKLNMEVYEVYPHLIVQVHDEIRIWKKMCAAHGLPKEI